MTAPTNNGGPAFPMQDPQAIHAYSASAIEGITDPDERDRAYAKARAEAIGGARLRDYFAAHAGNPPGSFLREVSGESLEGDAEYHARWKYAVADAMLRAREAT